MEMYCGIDLHATNSWLCVIDEVGSLGWRREVPNRSSRAGRLEPYREQLQRGGGGVDLQLVLAGRRSRGAGYPMRLANPSAMKRYEGLKYSDDRHDARWIAEMLRLGILPTGYIYRANSAGARSAAAPRAPGAQSNSSAADVSEPRGPRDRATDHGQRAQATRDQRSFRFRPESRDQLAVSSSLEIVDLLDEKILEIEKVVVRGVEGRSN